MDEHKLGPCQRYKNIFFFNEGCSNSAILMSAQLASWRKRHGLFVRLEAEWTKVVIMGAPITSMVL